MSIGLYKIKAFYSPTLTNIGEYKVIKTRLQVVKLVEELKLNRYCYKVEVWKFSWLELKYKHTDTYNKI